MQGQSTKEIAECLCVAVSVVNNDLRDAVANLRLKNCLWAAAHVVRQGLVESPGSSSRSLDL